MVIAANRQVLSRPWHVLARRCRLGAEGTGRLLSCINLHFSDGIQWSAWFADDANWHFVMLESSVISVTSTAPGRANIRRSRRG